MMIEPGRGISDVNSRASALMRPLLALVLKSRLCNPSQHFQAIAMVDAGLGSRVREDRRERGDRPVREPAARVQDFESHQDVGDTREMVRQPCECLQSEQQLSVR